jgi:hypothetical protein
VLSFYPRGESVEDAVARGELVKALSNATESEEHARRTVDRLLETRRESPAPADIADAAEYVPAVITCQHPDSDCRWCFGTGYKEVRRNGYTGAAKCSCWRASGESE